MQIKCQMEIIRWPIGNQWQCSDALHFEYESWTVYRVKKPKKGCSSMMPVWVVMLTMLTAVAVISLELLSATNG